MKLRTRIQLSTTVVLTVLLIITNTSIYWIFKNTTITSEQNRLTKILNNVVKELNTNTSLSMEEVLQAYLISDGMIRIVDQNGKAVPEITTNKDYRNIRSHYDDDQFVDDITYNGSLFVIVSVPTMNENGEVVNLQIIENVDLLANNIQDLKWVVAYSTMSVIVIKFVISRFLGQFISLPIQRLTKTMNVIEEEGSFKQISVTDDRKDELNEMAMTFNRMMKRLEDSYLKQEQFVSDASHELKTPLTVIDSYVKLLKRWGKDRPEILEEAIDSIASESSRMKYLTEQLLQLAKSEEVIEIEKEIVDIVKITESTVQRLQKTFEYEIQFITDKCELYLKVHEQSFIQLLVILLDNAKKYSDDHIQIELKELKESVNIIVRDKGVGIPLEVQANVFDRMYRVDQTRSRKTGGSGLGLSIAKRIVEQHDGNITLESMEGIGSTFTVTLPKMEEY